MKAQVTESFGYNVDQIVSSDVIGMRYGSLFDSTQTMVAKIDDDTYQVQVVSWYDNEKLLHQPDGKNYQILCGNRKVRDTEFKLERNAPRVPFCLWSKTPP